MGLMVKAVKQGFYNDMLMYPGQVFEIEKIGDYSDSKRLKPFPGWMEPANPKAAKEIAAELLKPKAAVVPAAPKPVDLSKPAAQAPQVLRQKDGSTGSAPAAAPGSPEAAAAEVAAAEAAANAGGPPAGEDAL